MGLEAKVNLLFQQALEDAEATGEARGEARGKANERKERIADWVKNVPKLSANFQMSTEEAMDFLEIPAEYRKEVLTNLSAS